jgi:hypothetical protein
MSLINRYLKCYIFLTRVQIYSSVFETHVTDCVAMAVCCTTRRPYVCYHVLTADIFRKPHQVPLLFCIRRVPGSTMIRTSNILTDSVLCIVLLRPPMQILCYGFITSTKSPSFCMTTFSAILTNVALLLPQSRGRSDCRSTLVYAHMTSPILPTCEISLGPLTLPASQAGDFVGLNVL